MNSNFGNFHNKKYIISACNVAIFGNKTEDNEKKWILGHNTSPYWNYHRIWIMKKGIGYVKTVFGDYELTEGNVYYFPGISIISANCSYMEQYYLDFISADDTPLFYNQYSFKHISNQYNLIFELLNMVKEKYCSKTEIESLFCDYAIDTILSCFIEKQDDLSVAEFSSVLTYIDKNFYKTKNISSKDLAKLVNYSQQHFIKKFKELFNTCPKEYIVNKKLIMACHLLSTTNALIKDISRSCGFSDEFYFARVFVKKIGLSPTDYKKNMQLAQK